MMWVALTGDVVNMDTSGPSRSSRIKRGCSTILKERLWENLATCWRDLLVWFFPVYVCSAGQ